MISCYELRLAGALDVHPMARKSLSWGNKTATPAKPSQPAERNLFSDLEDDDPPADEQERGPDGSDEGESTE